MRAPSAAGRAPSRGRPARAAPPATHAAQAREAIVNVVARPPRMGWTSSSSPGAAGRTLRAAHRSPRRQPDRTRTRTAVAQPLRPRRRGKPTSKPRWRQSCGGGPTACAAGAPALYLRAPGGRPHRRSTGRAAGASIAGIRAIGRQTMIPSTYRRIVLVRRPPGEPAESDFRIEVVPTPQPGPGQVLVRVIYLSLDPYMRGRMRDQASYAAPVGIGEVMTGGTVGEVAASQHP